jgi:hypothetical protein
MKKDTLFEHKEATITCEESMGDTNEYQKLLEPPIKQEKNSKGRRTNVICGQCNKPKHSNIPRSATIGIKRTKQQT